MRSAIRQRQHRGGNHAQDDRDVVGGGGPAIGTASAQGLLKPGTPSILRWTLEQQTEWYPAIETVYRTATVKRGDYVRPLPKADRTLEVSYSHGEKSWTVDDYMKATNVSGVMVVKDGKVLLERYGLGRKPEDRWISFSVTKSITSTLVGAAIQDGKIKSLDDQVTHYIPQLAGSAYEGVSVAPAPHHELGREVERGLHRPQRRRRPRRLRRSWSPASTRS